MELPLEDAIRLVSMPSMGRLRGTQTLVRPDSQSIELQDGTYLNVVNRTPDASELYCVAWNSQLLWEGWLNSHKVEDLQENQHTVASCYRLPIPEVLKHTVLAKAKEPWQNVEFSENTLLVEEGDLFQICTWRDGWAYATSLKESWQLKDDTMQKCRRSGWVPIFVLELVGSSLSVLSEHMVQEKLSESAVSQLHSLTVDQPRPPALSDPQMPEVVARSNEAELKFWRQTLAMEEEPVNDGNNLGQEVPVEPQDDRPQLLELREPPEESCPLYVCIQDCGPPPGKVLQEGHEHLLKLRKGDVVRVVSRIEPQQKWLQGYVDSMEQNKPRGWFPRERVESLQKENVTGASLSKLLAAGLIMDEASIGHLKPKLPPNLRRGR